MIIPGPLRHGDKILIPGPGGSGTPFVWALKDGKLEARSYQNTGPVVHEIPLKKLHTCQILRTNETGSPVFCPYSGQPYRVNAQGKIIAPLVECCAA